MLEMRLDNLVYRLGFASSRRAARQLVLHNHVMVNGRKANIPSRVLKAGDYITVKDHKKSRELAQRSLDATEGKTLVPWLELDRKNFRGEILHVPARDEMMPLVDEQLIVEMCSK